MSFLPSTLTVVGTVITVTSTSSIEPSDTREVILYKDGSVVQTTDEVVTTDFALEESIALILWTVKITITPDGGEPDIWEYGFYLNFDEAWSDWGPIAYDPNQYIFASTEAGTYICTLRLPISQQVANLILPETIGDSMLGQLKMKWQEILYEGIGVSLENRYSEYRWPYLANTLISYLIVRDTVYNSLSAAALSASSASAAGKGSIKKIETGPVNIERHDAGTLASKAFATMFSRPGLWEDIQSQLCGLAGKFGIHVSGCKNDIVVPLKIIRASDYSYQNQYPITPATAKRPSE